MSAGQGIAANTAAPPPGTVLCRNADITEGQARAFSFRDGAALFEMFIYRYHGALRAFVNSCPHAGTPLDWRPGAFFSQDGAYLLCSTHGALFRPEDGICVSGPCRGQALTPVPVATHGEDIKITAGTMKTETADSGSPARDL